MASHEVLLFSDIHLHTWEFGSSIDSQGFNSRLTGGLKVIDRVYEEASSRGIKYIIFTGDLFHVRNGVSPQVLHRTFECFKDNSYSHPDVEIFLMLGNHDFTRDMKFTSVRCLSSIPRVKVISEPIQDCKLFGGDILASFNPYTPDSDCFRRLLTSPSCPDVHFAHQGFGGLAQDPRNYYIDEIASVDDMSQWFGRKSVEIISGHYHDHALLTGSDRDLDSLYGFFVGAPSQQNFGDVGANRGFLTYELGSRKPVFHSLEDINPLFVDVSEDTPISELNISGNFVRCLAYPDVMEDLVTHTNKFNPEAVVKKYLVQEPSGLNLEPELLDSSHFESAKKFLFNKGVGLNRERLICEYTDLVN